MLFRSSITGGCVSKTISVLAGTSWRFAPPVYTAVIIIPIQNTAGKIFLIIYIVFAAIIFSIYNNPLLFYGKHRHILRLYFPFKPNACQIIKVNLHILNLNYFFTFTFKTLLQLPLYLFPSIILYARTLTLYVLPFSRFFIFILVAVPVTLAFLISPPVTYLVS